ncbi:hypothetical protein AncyloWKF20_07455 [Ancylobacter sp. WKF20]|uniref:hypothetical protein n=1 Tax=Ancylobacter sp. WKF20 TaxID=3039801 RepID=UPI0024345E90|nr:hypothetical protein [Ancylobacter sp. WKF20]WGD31645.1 hypothetical protein AncyloWKF20_07455 [Ancylobacter sp. WKF20]
MLTSYTGPLLRARRASDNSEMEFGARGDGWLDTSALLSWAGTSSVLLVALYDQTGQARHAVQATAARQPRLVNAGVLDAVNDRPTIRFDGSDDFLEIQGTTAFSNGRGALTLGAVVLRRGEVANVSQQVVYANTATGLTRANIGFLTTESYKAVAGGRRLDSDSYQRIVSPSVPAVNNWWRLIGRHRYSAAAADLAINGVVTTGGYQTAGLTASTPQTVNVLIGATQSPGEWLVGSMTAVVAAQAALDIAALDAALAKAAP